MKILRRNRILSVVFAAMLLVLGIFWWRVNATNGDDKTKSATASAVKPALTVTMTTPFPAEWPEKLSANGNIAAWQEALIGAEVGGLRLTEVKVNVGEMVRQGQILAVFSSVTVRADVAQALAAVAEAEAMLAEAKANANRARHAEAPGAISAQQISEYLTAERTAAARSESALAQLANQQTRLQQTQLIAPDDGVISARTATVGAVVSVGQELFRLIRFNRLEWRAEVTAAELPKVLAGQKVTIYAPGGVQARGTVRMVAPTVDPQNRMALIYVDIPADTGLKAGMFARGDFELGRNSVLALPQSAIVQREGFSFVYRIGADDKVSQTKVEIGRRLDQSIEIRSGLEQNTNVVATGAAFLADGDTVRIVDASGSPLGNAR
jgi:HlyD family secretion protein